MALPSLLAALALGGCATLDHASQAGVLRAKDRVAPALVHIRPVKEVYARGQREEVVTIGSGFIISPDGYVVTNEHVAGESSFVRCVLGDKEEVSAEVVGVDALTDIALLKLDADRPLPYVRFGDSDRIESGQTVLALGSPHGLARSVSLGIISVTDRYLGDQGPREAPYNNWIQTDAAINPGNSGGPLVNLRGEVIGVNARVLRGADNVGFAIPSNVAREVVEAIKRDGRVQRSWLGLDLQEMLARTDDPAREGVIIAGVDPLSPAHEAGLRPGDVLREVNGRPVHARFEEDLPAVRKRIADLPVNQAASLRVERAGESIDFEVSTEERADLRGQQVEFPEWGFTATELTPALQRRAQLPTRQGVYLTGVQPGGIAGNAGLNEGEVILEIDGEAIPSLEFFREEYAERVESGQRLVLLFVRRAALTRYVMVKQQPGPHEELPPPGDAPAEPVL